MGALPKRKLSKARRGNRRAHWTLRTQRLVTCPQCGAPVRPHHVCLGCGTYHGTQVLKIEEES